MTPGNLTTHLPPPLPFLVNKVLAGTTFSMMRKVSSSLELGTLTTPICESYIYSTKSSLLRETPIQVQTLPKLLNLCD